MLKRFVLTCLIPCVVASALPSKSGTEDGSKNLYLTHFIENDKLDEGRRLSEVTGFNWPMKSYSGLLTVNKTLGSNMFFWFFPSENEPNEVPLLVWLNGLKTASSYGVFLQNGPYDLLDSDELKQRPTSWQKYYNVLYIDNPVGVGFSYTKSDEGYSNDFTSLGSNLHNALKQFLKLFPSLAQRELYLSGSSLAGKYIPVLAYSIFKEKSFNMKGIFLGNPFLHPKTQLHYGEYLLQHGFIDKREKLKMDLQEQQLLEILDSGDYQTFYEKSSIYIGRRKGYIINVTGLDSLYDYNNPHIDTKYYLGYINKQTVKDALHVGEIQFSDGKVTEKHLANIVSESVLNMLEQMVEDIPILIYVGQLDVVWAYPMLVDTLSVMNWSGKDGYLNAEREMMRDVNGVWGYKKTYKTLTEVLVRNASHSAVTSQPTHILDLLREFTDYHRFL